MPTPLKIFLCLLISFSTLSIQAKPYHVVLASDTWPPYYGPNLPNQGYFSEIVRAAFKQSGYTSEFRFMPWQRALNLAKKGKYDGILGAYYKQDRIEYFEYSEPIIKIDVVFVSYNNREIQYETLSDLTPYTIAYVFGYHYTDDFDNAKNLRKIKGYSIEKNIELLINNKVDLVIGSKSVIEGIIKNKYPEFKQSVKVLSPVLTAHHLYVPISKNIYNSKRLLKSFNDGLKEIKKNGTYNKIMQKHGL